MASPRRSEVLWYKDAIIYELHVRAFYDSDGDGIGDFRGLTDKLDYFHDLGVTTLWLLPFYPSPLRDDGYDIADYTAVNPSYGTLQDFKRFLDEAHKRDLTVITELVLNHTSNEHPWFQRARRAPEGSVERDFYVWSHSPDRYKDARIIFKDFETSNWTWDPVARSYFWHRFYSHQPDLNFDNPAVHEALLAVVDFWMGLGVDGVRLDAVPYLYEREGTICENLAETHAFLKKLRAHVDQKFTGRMLLAEANQWPEDAVAYFGNGDECHMEFHFPVMPRMFMALELEDRFPIVDIMEQTPELPESCQWAMFLRNHDELTLEMVTDEDRDYMYRIYANDPQARINLGIRRRLAPLLGERRKIELMNALLFSLPGTPVVYYADEIGMGDNIYLGDRNGVRTPMQWSGDRNAGFSRANPQRLYLPVIIDPEYHYEAVNVEAQENNANSLLWWMKRLISLRKRYRAFGRGTFQVVHADNHKVLAYLRQLGDEVILVVANLSRYGQACELDLSSFAGAKPLELFGQSSFPAIGAEPYRLSLGPHGFFWFALQKPREVPAYPSIDEQLPMLDVDEKLSRLFEGQAKRRLEVVLPRYLHERRWFRGKARIIKDVEIYDVLTLGVSTDADPVFVALLKVSYQDHEAENYLLPIAFADDERAVRLAVENPQAVFARLSIHGGTHERQGLLFDAAYDKRLGQLLAESLQSSATLQGRLGTASFVTTSAIKDLNLDDAVPGTVKTEQTNTSLVFGTQMVMKLLRRIDDGTSPELDMGRFLTERAHYKHTPPLLGAWTYQTRKGPATLAVAHAFVPNQGDAWTYSIDVLSRFYEWAAANKVAPEQVPLAGLGLQSYLRPEFPEIATTHLGGYLANMQLLGQRVAELHRALASDVGDAAFAPELFTPHYQRSLYEFVRTRAQRATQGLRSRIGTLAGPTKTLAQRLLDAEKELQQRLRRILDQRVTAQRIRCHGDLHLGQVLHTGNDFMIIDFEGEPGRALGERRFKRSALTDVAGMLRSFDYAASYALRHRIVRAEDIAALGVWAEFFRSWSSAAFLSAYLKSSQGAGFLPETDDELTLLLELYVLEKAFYEIGYELNHRPDWLNIPLRGVLQLLGDSE